MTDKEMLVLGVRQRWEFEGATTSGLLNQLIRLVLVLNDEIEELKYGSNKGNKKDVAGGRGNKKVSRGQEPGQEKEVTK